MDSGAPLPLHHLSTAAVQNLQAKYDSKYLGPETTEDLFYSYPYFSLPYTIISPVQSPQPPPVNHGVAVNIVYHSVHFAGSKPTGGSLSTLAINGTPPEVENLSSCMFNADMSEASETGKNGKILSPFAIFRLSA